ncbi:MAG: hypothetical protein GY756_26885 [bacterium]|nr:hypothetical protein [bacterium]
MSYEGTNNKDYYLELKKGNISGEEQWDGYGRNTSIGTGTTPEDAWNGGGIYTGQPTGAAETMEIRSSDANDTSAGTGARTVRIYNLLDDTGASMPDLDITLNGTSWVSLGVLEYFRGGSKMKVLTAGSGGENAGELTLRHTTTTANVFAVMPAGRNETAIGAYTVPLGKTLYMRRPLYSMSRANGSAGSANVTLRARAHGGVYLTIIPPEITDAHDFNANFPSYFKFEERTDITNRCESVSDNGTILSVDMAGILVDN